MRTIQVAIKSRRDEVAQYEAEARLHQRCLAQLDADGVPDEWPERLARYRTMDRASLVAECPDADIEAVIGLQMRQRANGALREISIELRKSRALLDALVAELGDTPEDALALDPLRRGLKALGEVVKSPDNSFTRYAVDAASLRKTDDGGGIGRVQLTDADGNTHARVVIVSGEGQVSIVDGV